MTNSNDLHERIIKKWDLNNWWQILISCEDIASKVAVKIKIGNNIDNVIIKNYTRIILSLREMYTLLLNGYPDGALSIARNIYEISIITQFIYKNYISNKNLIDRYSVDQDVKAYRNKRELYKILINRGSEFDFLKEHQRECSQQLKNLEKSYGNIYAEYWWANGVLNSKRISFRQIDLSVNNDKLLRVLYNRACISIHASSMGSVALLGRDNEKGDRLYSSHTEDGFEAPLLLGMISLENITDIFCDYWNLNKSDIYQYQADLYSSYITRVFV